MLKWGNDMNKDGRWIRYASGEPCKHPGCKSHISHPCEGCGRVGSIGNTTVYERWETKNIGEKDRTILGLQIEIQNYDKCLTEIVDLVSDQASFEVMLLMNEIIKKYGLEDKRE